MEEVVKYLKALLALQVRVFSEAQPAIKVEVLLNRVGLTHAEIAEVTGKKTAAVAKTISRSR
jgi:DNA-directed RNA polymerase specialized sigma24 family protein